MELGGRNQRLSLLPSQRPRIFVHLAISHRDRKGRLTTQSSHLLATNDVCEYSSCPTRQSPVCDLIEIEQPEQHAPNFLQLRHGRMTSDRPQKTPYGSNCNASMHYSGLLLNHETALGHSNVCYIIAKVDQYSLFQQSSGSRPYDPATTGWYAHFAKSRLARGFCHLSRSREGLPLPLSVVDWNSVALREITVSSRPEAGSYPPGVCSCLAFVQPQFLVFSLLKFDLSIGSSQPWPRYGIVTLPPPTLWYATKSYTISPPFYIRLHTSTLRPFRHFTILSTTTFAESLTHSCICS